MTNEANSGYLVNCMCAEPCPRYGEKKDLTNVASALEMLKIARGGENKINTYNAGVIKPFVQSHGQQ